MSGKLTKAQIETLSTVARYDNGTSYAEYYAPIKKLLALGLVEKIEGRFSDRFKITPSGREALKAAQ